MGSIIAGFSSHPGSLSSLRLKQSQHVAPYRGEMVIEQHDHAYLAVQRRHCEATLLKSDRSLLALNGYVAATNIDGSPSSGVEVIQHRLDAGDFRYLHSLDGEFSLVYLDKTSSQRVFYCSHSATRPLYFTHVNDLTVVCSEAGQALHLSNQPRLINGPAWTQYLVFGHQSLNLEATLYKNLQRAQSGCIYIQHRDNSDLQKLPYEQHPEADYQMTPESAGEILLETVKTAVGDCLRDDKMALALSGGLDSGLILAVATEIQKQQPHIGEIKAYSIHYPGWAMDESNAIAQNLAYLEKRGQHVDGTRRLASSFFRELSESLDLLPAVPTDCYIDMLAPSMTADGCRYRLSGFAGDFSLGFGLSYLHDFARNGQLLTALKDATLFGNRAKFSPKTALRRILRGIMFHPCKYRLRQPRFPGWLTSAQREVAHAVLSNECRYIEDFGTTYGPKYAVLDVLRSGAWSDLVEQRCAQWGLETLNPLAHQKMFELTSRIPPRLFDGGQHNRFLVRKAARKLLPPSLRGYQPKVIHNHFMEADTEILQQAPPVGEWRLVEERLADPVGLAKLLKETRDSGKITVHVSRLLRAESLARRCA